MKAGKSIAFLLGFNAELNIPLITETYTTNPK
jgi:hypothetical protein